MAYSPLAIADIAAWGATGLLVGCLATGRVRLSWAAAPKDGDKSDKNCGVRRKLLAVGYAIAVIVAAALFVCLRLYLARGQRRQTALAATLAMAPPPPKAPTVLGT